MICFQKSCESLYLSSSPAMTLYPILYHPVYAFPSLIQCLKYISINVVMVCTLSPYSYVVNEAQCDPHR